MYSSLWSPGLRQGDIFGEIRFPVWTDRIKWVFPGNVSLSVTDNPEVGFVKTQPRFVVVISHDCEFNEGKRSFFLVARIENIQVGLSDEQLKLLRRANDLRSMEDGVQVPVDTFVLDPVLGAFENRMRVNFCTVTPLPMTYLSEALKLKRAELQHDQRILLRSKLGYFFGRDAEDISEGEKKPPEGSAPAQPPLTEPLSHPSSVESTAPAAGA